MMASSSSSKCTYDPDSFCYTCIYILYIHVYVTVTNFFIKSIKYQNLYALLINPTSTFPLVTKTKSGLRILFAIIVRRVFATGQRGNVRDYLSECRWFGESQRITSLTAISVSSTLKASVRKIGIEFFIPVLHLQFYLFRIHKKSAF